MSQLATQLRALSKGAAGGKPVSRPSLLFGQSDVDTHTTFELGQNGFGELKLLDERFGQFESLFRHADSKVFDRGSQTAAKLTILDSLIEGMLQLLSPYLLLKPAHKTLEYLIRRYQIVEKHQGALIACILPFHQTEIFGRIVQLMKLPPQWGFLKSSPDPLIRRSVIVQHCINDTSILDFICKMAKNSATGRTPQVTFFTVVVMEVLGTYKKDPEKLILLLLPYINHGLSADKHSDLHKSSLMLIAFMGSRFSIHENVVEALALRILGTIEQGDTSEGLLPVISLIQSQRKLPKKVFDRLRLLPGFSDILNTARQSYNLDELVALFVPRLIEEVKSNEVSQEEEMLIQLIKSIPKSQAPSVLQALFGACISRPQLLSAYSRVLCSLDQEHPDAVDEVIQQELASQGPSRYSILQLIKRAMPHSRHHVLDEFGTTLLLALDHPKAEVRLSAISSGYVSEDATIRDRLVGKINDPDPKIQKTILQNPSLVTQVNSTLLLQSLLEVLENPTSNSNLLCLALRQLGFVVKHDVQSEFNSRLLPCILHFLSAGDGGVRKAAVTTLNAQSDQLRDLFGKLSENTDLQWDSGLVRQLQIIVVGLSGSLKKPDITEFFISSIANSHATFTSARMMGLCVLAHALPHCPDLGPRFLELIVQFWSTIAPRERVVSVDDVLQVNDVAVPPMFSSLGAVVVHSLNCILQSCNMRESGGQALLQSLFTFVGTIHQDFGRFLLAQIRQRLGQTDFKLLFPFLLAKHKSSTQSEASLGVVPTASVVASFQILEVSLDNLDLAIALPCVIVGLGNASKAVRYAALSVVRALQTKHIQAQPLLSLIMRLREEFLADGLFLTNNFTVQTSTLDASTLGHVCETLLHFLNQGYAYANAIIVSFLRFMPVGVLAKGTFPVLLKLLEMPLLSAEEKVLAPLLIEHITHESLSNAACFPLLLAVLKSSLMLEGNRSVSSKGLEQINPVLFKACTVSQQNELFQCLCELTKRPEASSAKQVLERIAVDSSLLRPHLNMALGFLTKSEHKDMSLARVTTLVEVLYIILPANKLHDLVLPLFDLLAATFHATSQPVGEIEFLKQLLLAALLQYFKQTSFDEKLKTKFASLNLSPLIGCVTPSVSNEPLRSQTRNSALLLYSAVAPIFPRAAQDVVLRMFDFPLGSMDSHSFAVIQQTIETMLPPIIHTISTDSLIPVFVDMACAISANQALRLLTVLHSALARCFDSLPASFLHESVAWLLQKTIMIDSKEVKEDHDSLFSEPAFLHLLFQGFSLAEQVASLVALVDIVVKSESAAKAKSAMVIKKLQTKERIQKWQACVLEFVGAQLGHPSFVEKSADGGLVEQYYVKLFERLFALSRLLKEAKSPRKDASQVALSRLNQLLSLPIFVSVVKALLTDSDPAIQRKALQLLHDKVSKKRQDDELLLVAVLPCLQALILETTEDNILTMVFTCVQTLCGFSPGVANKEVLELLPKLQQWVSRRLSDERPEKRKVAVQGIKCLGSVASHLGMNLVPQLKLLSEMVTLVLDWLELSLQSSLDTESIFSDIRLSALFSLQAIVSAVPPFVSPYLTRIITALIHPLLSSSSQASANTQATLATMSTSIEARVLLPVVFSLWKPSISLGSLSVQRLCWFLSTIVSHFTSQVARAEYKGIFQFLLQSFDLRRSHPMTDMDVVEDAIVTATVNILLKLRETELKSLFMGILDWLNVLNDADSPNVNLNMDRYVIFFRLVLQLSVTLKSVFVPYFNYFVNLSIQILRLAPEKVQSKKKRTADGNGRSLQTLVQSLIIRSLHQAFMADTNRALPRDFFDRLMEPLVDQLPAEAVGPCLEELVARLGSHVLWKPLNRLVLLKTRSPSVQVRLAAVDLLTKFFTRFGENWLVLLPETLSYIAELMEDQEQEVQRAVQTLIQTIEQLSGESLASALT